MQVKIEGQFMLGRCKDGQRLLTNERKISAKGEGDKMAVRHCATQFRIRPLQSRAQRRRHGCLHSLSQIMIASVEIPIFIINLVALDTSLKRTCLQCSIGMVTSSGLATLMTAFCKPVKQAPHCRVPRMPGTAISMSTPASTRPAGI